MVKGEIVIMFFLIQIFSISIISIHGHFQHRFVEANSFKKSSLDIGTTQRCLSEKDRLFACIPSAITENLETRFGMLTQLLDNLNLVHESGTRVDVVLHLSSAPPYDISYKSGMSVQTFVSKIPTGSITEKNRRRAKRGKKTFKKDYVSYHFNGLCRNSFREALSKKIYSYFLYSENDMNITFSHLDNLCKEFKFLDQQRRSGKTLRPGLLRYEGNNNSLTDLLQSSFMGNQIRSCRKAADRAQGMNRVPCFIQFAERRYFVPPNPFEALYFLPVPAFLKLVHLHNTYKKYDFYIERVVTEGKLIGEFHSGLWFHNYVIKVVPIENLENFLVKHMPENYVGKLPLLTLAQLRIRLENLEKKGYLK